MSWRKKHKHSIGNGSTSVTRERKRKSGGKRQRREHNKKQRKSATVCHPHLTSVPLWFELERDPPILRARGTKSFNDDAFRRCLGPIALCASSEKAASQRTRRVLRLHGENMPQLCVLLSRVPRPDGPALGFRNLRRELLADRHERAV